VEPPELRDLFDVWLRSGVDGRRGRLPLPHPGARVVRVDPGISGLAEKARRKGLGSHLPVDLDLRPRHVRTGKPLFEHLPALGDPRLHVKEDLFGGQDLGQLFQDLAPDVTPQHQHPLRPEVNTGVNRAVTAALRGEQAPRDAPQERQ
jgi:hypothetical protein